MKLSRIHCTPSFALRTASTLGAAFGISLALSMSAHGAEEGSDDWWKFGGFWSLRDAYRTLTEVNVAPYKGTGKADARVDCDTEGSVAIRPNSRFTVYGSTSDAKKQEAKIIKFDYLPDAGDANTTDFFALCTAGPNKPDAFAYKKSGGMTTGLLVVPFKLRSGDLFGDATVGPYVGFAGSRVSLLFTAGLTQVSVKDLSTTEVKSETGLTIATGLVFKVTEEFDVAVVVGADHLSGAAGDAFKYQHKPWFSFAIGYNFTRQ